MGYSLIAIAEKEPEWAELHGEVFNPNGPIEMFPIDEGDGKFYLGINIPSSKYNAYPNTWEELEKTIRTLLAKYNFMVFDLYGGFYIDDENIAEVKKQLTGE